MKTAQYWKDKFPSSLDETSTEIIRLIQQDAFLSGQLKGILDAAEIVYAIWTQSPVGTSADVLQHKIRCAILSGHDKLKGVE